MRRNLGLLLLPFALSAQETVTFDLPSDNPWEDLFLVIPGAILGFICVVLARAFKSRPKRDLPQSLVPKD